MRRVGKQLQGTHPPPDYIRRGSSVFVTYTLSKRPSQLHLSNMPAPAVGLFVPLEAQPDKAADLKGFLEKGRELIDNEPLTLQWYAVKYEGEAYASKPTYAIFDTFASEEGQKAHKEGQHAVENTKRIY